MARDITGTLGGRVKAHGDSVFDAQALPNATTVTSSAFKFGKSQSGVELVVSANTNISIADSKQLKVEILYDTADDGSFASSKVVYDVTASGSAVTFAVNDVISATVPDKAIETWAKVKVTTTANESSEKIDAFIYRVSR